MYSNGYRNGGLLEQSKLVGQSIDCGPRSVVTGVPIDVSGYRDRRMTKQVDGLNVQTRFQPRRPPRCAVVNIHRARRLRRDLYGTQDVAWIDRCTELSREHQALVAPLVAGGSLIGGFLGSHYGRRLSPKVLRVVIVIVGLIGLYRLLTV